MARHESKGGGIMAIASHNRRVHEAFARTYTPMVKGRWAVRATPTAQTVAIEDSVARNASLLVMCDVDCGFPSWDVEIATLAIDAFRSAYAHVDERLPTTEAVHHAINYALMAARLDAYQKIGRAPTQNNDAEATFDGISLLAIVTEANQIDIAQIGTSQLWVQRDSQVYPIVSQPSTTLRFMTRNLRADDRIVACTAAVADHISATEIENVLANESADNVVAASLMPGADSAAPTIATAACMTFRQSRSLPAQRPLPERRPMAALPASSPQRVPMPAVTDDAGALPTTLASLPVIGLLSMAMAALLITLFLLFQLPPLRLTQNAGVTSGANSLEGTATPSFALPPTLTPLPSAIQPTRTAKSAPSATPTANATSAPARPDRIQPTRAGNVGGANNAGSIIRKLNARPSTTPVIPPSDLRALPAQP
jgi:hypothetical protein